MRMTARAVIRIELVLLLPLLVTALVLAVDAGGLWLLLIAPLWLGLLGLARAARLGSPREWLRAASSAVLALAVFGFAALAIAPHLGIYRPVTVLSGSMRPVFSPGDLIFVTPERLRDVRVGQVITYATPGGDHHIQTHRVVEVLRGGDRPIIVTKGDANNAADPFQAELQGPTAWRYRFRVPAAGHVILALRSPAFHFLTIIGLPVLLALFGLSAIWKTPVAQRPVEFEFGA
jgi:signal peptidase